MLHMQTKHSLECTIAYIKFYLNFRYQGHMLARELADVDLQTTVITDSAVFAMISRVNMVGDICLSLLKTDDSSCCAFTVSPLSGLGKATNFEKPYVLYAKNFVECKLYHL
jgi:hypothetical protein